MATCYCERCNREMDEKNFYTYKDGRKAEICKLCLTAHVDNFDPETFTWILEKFDVPYLPSEWNVLRDRAFAKDPAKMTGISVLGKYLSKMRLKKWKDYSWADSEKLQQHEEDMKAAHAASEAELERRQKEMIAKVAAGEMSEAQYQTLTDTAILNEQYIASPPEEVTNATSFYQEDQFISEEELNIGEDLTHDDKIALATKWGRLYKPSEYISLEKSYREYEKSFDLHNADLRRGTLQLCKLDLKMNQAIDCGDYDGYSKLARASDQLRKSLKFTEAQRKDEKSADFSCYGQIVSFCELHNYEDSIPMIDLKVDRDIVDRDIRDIKNWTKTLVEDDPTIYRMIEQYIKKRENLESYEEDQANLAPGEQYQITDADLKEFRDLQEQQKKEDEEVIF